MNWELWLIVILVAYFLLRENIIWLFGAYVVFLVLKRWGWNLLFVLLLVLALVSLLLTWAGAFS